MAGAVNVKSGTKLKVAYDMGAGKSPEFNLVCTFIKSLDESAFYISVPMKAGKSLVFDENQKLLILIGAGSAASIVAGYPDDEVKEGIHRYWKIRRVSEQRQFIERADERYKVALKVLYTSEMWPIKQGKRDYRDAMSLDISAGGAAIFLNFRFEVGEVCELTLPTVGYTDEGYKIEHVVSAVCWYREAPKGSAFKYLCGVQFRFANSAERERMKAYILNLKKKYKLE